MIVQVRVCMWDNIYICISVSSIKLNRSLRAKMPMQCMCVCRMYSSDSRFEQIQTQQYFEFIRRMWHVGYFIHTTQSQTHAHDSHHHHLHLIYSPHTHTHWMLSFFDCMPDEVEWVVGAVGEWTRMWIQYMPLYSFHFDSHRTHCPQFSVISIDT